MGVVVNRDATQRGSQFTLLPLLENLHLALEESSTRLSMKWDSKAYVAAWFVLEHLRTIVIPAARSKGDIVAIEKLSALGSLWKKSEFQQDFLGEVIEIPGAKARKRRHVHLSYGEILEETLQAMDTLIENTPALSNAARGGLQGMGISVSSGGTK